MTKLKKWTIILCVSLVFSVGILILVSSIKSPSNPGPDEPPVSENRGDIYTETIESIKLRFYEGYNIASGNIVNSTQKTIPLNEINLTEANFEKASSLVRSLRKIKISKDTEKYSHLMNDNLFDRFELVVNGNFVLEIGEEYGMINGTEDVFAVPEELFNLSSEIARKYAEENLYQPFGGTEYTVSYLLNESEETEYEIVDEEQKEKIANFKYYVMGEPSWNYEEDKNIYKLDMHDGRVVELCRACIFMRIAHEDGSYEYIYTEDLEDYIYTDILNRPGAIYHQKEYRNAR